MSLANRGWKMLRGFAGAALFVAASLAQNASSPLGVCRSASASPTAYTCPAPPLSTYLGDLSVSWTPDATNTTQTPTLNLGPGPKSLKDAAGSAPLIGSLIAGGVYIVAYDGTNIRVVSGPGVNPTMTNYQQSIPTICYDTNDTHTSSFACSRTPTGALLTGGSTILFRFAASTNGLNPCVDVEVTGCAQISFSDGSALPPGSLAGDDSGTENYYFLTFDADDDLWILANQLLPSSGTPALTSCGTGPAIVGTDRGGTVTEGSAASGCIITFTVATAAAAACTVTSQSGLQFLYTTSTTAIGIVNVGALSSTKVNYVCAR
jgi:hypothetical protein